MIAGLLLLGGIITMGLCFRKLDTDKANGKKTGDGINTVFKIAAIAFAIGFILVFIAECGGSGLHIGDFEPRHT